MGQYAGGMAVGSALAARCDFGGLRLFDGAAIGVLEGSATLFTHAIAVTKDNYIAHEEYEEYLVENHRWDEARAQCRRALDIWPDFGAAHLWLGIILYHDGKFDEAKREITSSLKDRWNVERGEEYLGKIALEQDLPAEAEVAFSKELEFNPALPAGRCGLGPSLGPAGKSGGGSQGIKKALHLLPDYPEALNSLAWMLASHPQADTQDGNDAVNLAARASQLTLYQQAPEIETLAAAYAAAGRFDEAVATAQRAYDLAVAQGRKHLAAQCLEMHELFRSHRPYREPVPRRPVRPMCRKTLQNGEKSPILFKTSILRMKKAVFLRFAVGISYTFAKKRDGTEMQKKDVRC